MKLCTKGGTSAAFIAAMNYLPTDTPAEELEMVAKKAGKDVKDILSFIKAF